jgi:hypothetical protein
MTTPERTESVTATDRARQEAVLQQVVNVVEPRTRFGRAGLADASAVATEAVPITARQRYHVALRIDFENGPGGLPDGTVGVADATAMRLRLNAALATVARDLPDRLRRWWTAHYGEVATLAESDCRPAASAIGYIAECRTCGATGWLQCGNCGGRTTLTCAQCRGAGNYNCTSCNYGRTTCGVCGGRGHREEQRQRTESSGTHGDQVIVTVYYTERVNCNACGGSGTQTCGYCGGKVVITCAPCGGSGSIPCAHCGATGWVRCTLCDTTGWRYECGWLRAGITESFDVRAETARAEPRRFLHSRSGLNDLWPLVEGLSCDEDATTLTDDSLTRTFTGTTIVTVLSLIAATLPVEPFEIVGYGDPPTVYDYKNVIGRLLEVDLKALESALARTPKIPWRPWRPTAALETALARFLESDANYRIGAWMNESPEWIAQFAPDFFQQAVSPNYVVRAAKAERDAALRLHRSGAPLIIAALLLLPMTILVVAQLREWIPYGPIPALTVAVAAFAACLLLEWLARWRVRRHFGPGLAAETLRLLTDSGALRRARRLYRGSAIAGGLIGWIGAAFLLAYLYVHVGWRPSSLSAAPWTAAVYLHRNVYSTSGAYGTYGIRPASRPALPPRSVRARPRPKGRGRGNRPGNRRH